VNRQLRASDSGALHSFVHSAGDRLVGADQNTPGGLLGFFQLESVNFELAPAVKWFTNVN
jgi:hypothetical protein